MNKFLLGLLVLIGTLSKEELAFNEEIVIIICFILSVYLLVNLAGEGLSSFLVSRSEDQKELFIEKIEEGQMKISNFKNFIIFKLNLKAGLLFVLNKSFKKNKQKIKHFIIMINNKILNLVKTVFSVKTIYILEICETKILLKMKNWS